MRRISQVAGTAAPTTDSVKKLHHWLLGLQALKKDEEVVVACRELYRIRLEQGDFNRAEYLHEIMDTEVAQRIKTAPDIVAAVKRGLIIRLREQGESSGDPMKAVQEYHLSNDPFLQTTEVVAAVRQYLVAVLTQLGQDRAQVADCIDGLKALRKFFLFPTASMHRGSFCNRPCRPFQGFAGRATGLEQRTVSSYSRWINVILLSRDAWPCSTTTAFH